MGAAAISRAVKVRLREAGFDDVGITRPEAVGDAGDRFRTFLERGFHGTMSWMADKADRRADPHVLWPDTRSIIMAAMNYGPDTDPLEALEHSTRGAISVYAGNRDYHDVLKGKLKQVAGWLNRSHGIGVKVFVDTAPVLEKPLAASAGLGWQGKHTNVVSRSFGSWLFLGAIFTDADLETDAPETDHCGSCRACLDICPTDAFPAPYQLDARRCISYLTIEHKGPIPVDFREAIGNRIYGCDDCLAVCPWNKFATRAAEAKFHARADLATPPLGELARLDDGAFRKLFSGSPVKRLGRDRFVRNVVVAMGNSGDAELAPAVEDRLADTAPVVRAMAVWALRRLGGDDRFAASAARLAPRERDDMVLAEWQRCAA